MMRVAIICEPGFSDKHVGVRALFSTVAKAAELAGAEVSLLVQEAGVHGDRWMLVTPTEASLASNFALTDERIDGAPDALFHKLTQGWFETHRAPFDDAYPAPRLALGSSPPEDVFDLAIYTAPWMWGLRERFPARRVVGIVYDTIPNSYALNGKVFGSFAAEHVRGFKFFATHCDEVWAISEETRVCYLEFCAISRIAPPAVRVVPPMLPWHLVQAAPAPATRTDTVVAVGLFDWRKGLADAPAILNATDRAFDLVIVGGVRVQEEAVAAFFDALTVARVTWYRSVRATTLADLYSRAKVLLFNSDAEGLGLPVIEAQSFGCRALASDVPSVLEVLLPGSVALPRTEPARFAAELDRMLAEPFDHDALAARAHEAFALRHLVAFVGAALAEAAA